MGKMREKKKKKMVRTSCCCQQFVFWLFVCFAFSAVFHNYFSIDSRKGIFVNWMETSIIIRMCVCEYVFFLSLSATLLIRSFFFSLHFFNFRQNSSGFHSVFIFFLGFFSLTLSKQKNLCAQYDYTLHSMVFFSLLFFSSRIW